MFETELDIQTPDGTMNTFITCPDEGGPFPVIMFLMDAPAKREELHDMARRIATVGYYVMLPNLYYRRTKDFVMDASPATRAVMFEHMNSLTNAMVMADCRALLQTADADPQARGGPCGVVGYCMSGSFVFTAAAQLSDRVRASASIYGVRLLTEAADSPHLIANQIKGEIYFACAEFDDWAPPAMIDELDQYLAATGINYRIEWYPGAHHGFAFPGRGTIYDKPSAERHWQRLFALFKRNL
jgi:carboxymethylenebutenolidase